MSKQFSKWAMHKITHKTNDRRRYEWTKKKKKKEKNERKKSNAPKNKMQTYSNQMNKNSFYAFINHEYIAYTGGVRSPYSTVCPGIFIRRRFFAHHLFRFCFLSPSHLTHSSAIILFRTNHNNNNNNIGKNKTIFRWSHAHGCCGTNKYIIL